MELPSRLVEQLEGKEGATRQKAARLVVDLAGSWGLACEKFWSLANFYA